jgi:phage tail-like protein
LSWDGRPPVPIDEVHGLRRTVDVVEHRDGAAPRLVSKLPGDLTFAPVTLERTFTGDTLFREVADAAADPGPGADARATVIVEVVGRTGRPLLRCHLHEAWVSSYEPYVEVEGRHRAAGVERIVVEFDAWTIEPL